MTRRMALVAGLVAAGSFLMFLPGAVLDGFGADEVFELDLLRFFGGVLAIEAGLVARVAAKRIEDDGWRGLERFGEVSLVLVVMFFTGGNPLFLLLAFSITVGVMLRTLMPVLDQWSREVRLRYEQDA